MTLANFASVLRSFSHRVPFQHYMAELVSGQIITVVHPEALALRGRIVAFVSPERQYRLFDSSSVCQLFDPPKG